LSVILRTDAVAKRLGAKELGMSLIEHENPTCNAMPCSASRKAWSTTESMSSLDGRPQVQQYNNIHYRPLFQNELDSYLVLEV
jgi:hypothetical protein